MPEVKCRIKKHGGSDAASGSPSVNGEDSSSYVSRVWSLH